MSHLLKAFLRIIHDRIRGKCERGLARNQSGFRKACGTLMYSSRNAEIKEKMCTLVSWTMKKLLTG